MIPVHKGPFKIPPITDSELRERSSRLRIAVERFEYTYLPHGFTRKSMGLWWIRTPADLRGVSFTWDPTYVEPAGLLTAISTNLTLHSFGYAGFFKPSVAEALACSPVVEGAKAFSLQGPDHVDDINHNAAARDAGFHVAEVTWYK